MINPAREPNSYLIFTTEEGGDYQVLADFTEEQWIALRATGYFEAILGDYPPELSRVYPAFAEYVKGVHNWDFVIDEYNGTRMPPEVVEFDLRREIREN